MAPSYRDLGRQRPGGPSQSRSAGAEDELLFSNGPAYRIRNEESWVEISSQPSSSSLSSIGDEIITTGLRVQQDPRSRRRRRATADVLSHPTSNSSQDEYDESESSSDDVVISSSTEHISSRLKRQSSYDAGSESDSSCSENLTALGTRAADAGPETAFTPQPNVFSQAQNQRRPGPQADSYFPRAPPSRPAYSERDRHSYPSRNSRPPQTHTPYNAYSPSHQADHDAALRASLTTLLSCAAAARGLPKRNQPSQPSSQQPTGLRMVPESALLASPPSPGKASDSEKGKRKTPKQDASRAAKKKKVSVVGEEMGLVSPTLLTWVVSAGVVVLVSAIGFSAGYAMGREVGRQEVLGGAGVPAGAFEGSGVGECGREVSRATGGLRRFRLGVAV